MTDHRRQGIDPPVRQRVAEPLRVPVFRRVWIAQTLLNTGHYLQAVAAAWVMLELTSSPLWVGLVVAAPHLPMLTLSVVAGALSDVIDRRRLLVGSTLVMGATSLTMSVLWTTGAITPLGLVALSLILGAGLAVFAPAWQASVPNLVPMGLVPGAIALNSASGAVATAVGPAVGGAMIAAVGPGWAFFGGTLGYLSMVAALSLIDDEPWRDDSASVGVAIMTGIRFVRFTAIYRWLLLTVALFGLTSASLRALLPSVTSDALQGQAETYGLLLGAMGAGAFLGALTRARAAGRLGDRLIPYGIVAFGFAGVGVGIAPSVGLAAISMSIAGVLWTWILASTNSAMQLLSPAWVRGRAMSVYMLAFAGFTPLGAIIAGALGELYTAATALVLCSTAVIATGLLARRLPIPLAEELIAEQDDQAVATDADPSPLAHGVTVTTSFHIPSEVTPEFLDAIAGLRLIRLQTGARRWHLSRHIDDPCIWVETFSVATWDEHVRQHDRLTPAAYRLIRRIAALDEHQAPTTIHLIDVPPRRGTFAVPELELGSLHAAHGLRDFVAHETGDLGSP